MTEVEIKEQRRYASSAPFERYSHITPECVDLIEKVVNGHELNVSRFVLRCEGSVSGEVEHDIYRSIKDKTRVNEIYMDVKSDYLSWKMVIKAYPEESKRRVGPALVGCVPDSHIIYEVVVDVSGNDVKPEDYRLFHNLAKECLKKMDETLLTENGRRMRDVLEEKVKEISSEVKKAAHSHD